MRPTEFDSTRGFVGIHELSTNICSLIETKKVSSKMGE